MVLALFLLMILPVSGVLAKSGATSNSSHGGYGYGPKIKPPVYSSALVASLSCRVCRPGDTLTITLENKTSRLAVLSSSSPWQIEKLTGNSGAGTVVYAPKSSGVTLIGPGEKRSWSIILESYLPIPFTERPVYNTGGDSVYLKPGNYLVAFNDLNIKVMFVVTGDRDKNPMILLDSQ